MLNVCLKNRCLWTATKTSNLFCTELASQLLTLPLFIFSLWNIFLIIGCQPFLGNIRNLNLEIYHTFFKLWPLCEIWFFLLFLFIDWFIFYFSLGSKKGKTKIMNPKLCKILLSVYAINFQLQANWLLKLSIWEVFKSYIFWLLRSIVHDVLNTLHEQCWSFIYNYNINGYFSAHFNY